jgi:hypothetical protein
MSQQQRSRAESSNSLDIYRPPAPPEPPPPEPLPPPPAPTTETILAMIASLDYAEQFRLFATLLQDRLTHVGRLVQSLFWCERQRVECLEKLAGLAPGDIYPEHLLNTDETCAQARRRTNRATENAVRQARHKVRKRFESLPSPVSWPPDEPKR